MSSEVQSVARTLTIIEILAGNSEPTSLKEIAALSALPAPTAYRLLNTLADRGYVDRLSNGSYKLSYKLFELSSQNINTSSTVSTAKPYIDDLSDRLGESAHLVVSDNTNVVYVYKVTKAVGSFQMASRIGMSLPMYRCAVGKAILSTYRDSDILKVLDASNKVATTPFTLTDNLSILQQIYRVRETGYAIDDEENELGIKCFAAAIQPDKGPARYALSISTFKSRLTELHSQEIIRAIKETKQKIERAIIV